MARWGKRTVAMLERCAREGLTMTECAAKLGPPFNRNMVAGKAKRLGIRFPASADKLRRAGEAYRKHVRATLAMTPYRGAGAA